MESWDNGYSIVPPAGNRNPQDMNFLQISAHTIDILLERSCFAVRCYDVLPRPLQQPHRPH